MRRALRGTVPAGHGTCPPLARGDPPEWPLSNHAMRSTFARGTPRQLRQSWADDHNRLIMEDPGFPKTVHGHELCFDGECMAEHNEDQRAFVNHVLTVLRLICISHAGAHKRSFL